MGDLTKVSLPDRPCEIAVRVGVGGPRCARQLVIPDPLDAGALIRLTLIDQRPWPTTRRAAVATNRTTPASPRPMSIAAGPRCWPRSA